MIRFPQVMVIDDETGDKLGVMSSKEAQFGLCVADGATTGM